jgi:hypothetical protein
MGREEEQVAAEVNAAMLQGTEYIPENLIQEELERTLNQLKDLVMRFKQSRQLTNAITRFEEAEMWLYQCDYPSKEEFKANAETLPE